MTALAQDDSEPSTVFPQHSASTQNKIADIIHCQYIVHQLKKLCKHIHNIFSICLNRLIFHGYCRMSKNRTFEGISDQISTVWRHPIAQPTVLNNRREAQSTDSTRENHPSALSFLNAPTDSYDRRHNCNFIARLCHATLSRHKVAVCKCACRTLLLCRTNNNWPISVHRILATKLHRIERCSIRKRSCVTVQELRNMTCHTCNTAAQ